MRLTIFALLVSLSACSLFQPAATAPPPPTPQQVATVVQNTIRCMNTALVPCMTQPPPLNNAQLCGALAASSCAAAN